MSDETQEVALEAETKDVKVETPEAEVKETEDNTSPDTESDEGTTEGEEPAETAEEKLERLEREAAGKQKAIDRKTAAYHALQKKYDEQRQEQERLAKLIEQQTPGKEPVIDDYETHEEYVNALVEHRAKAEVHKEREKLMAQQAQMQQEQIMQERLKLRQSQEVEYLSKNPMYQTAANEVDLYIKGITDVSPATQEAVIAQMYDGNVPAVIDYFGANDGENLEELGAIARMTPPEAAVAIYKIQQKLSAVPVVNKKETAPKPKPVKVAKGSSNASKPLAKRSGSEVLDWVQAK